MVLIDVIIALAVMGVIMYLVNNVIPMAQPFRTVINAIVGIALVIWLLQCFGLVGHGVFWRRV